MILNNKQICYEVLYSNETFKVSGKINMKDDKTIVSLNGSIISISEDLHCGDFFYGEYPDGTVNKNLQNAKKEKIQAMTSFVDELIELIIAEIKANDIK